MTILEDRLRSRFEWGLITDVTPPDLETRIAILRKKADMDRLRVDELRSHNRSRTLVQARQIAMYLVREMTDLSLPKTGEVFGKDHTTVLHAIQKVKTLVSEKRAVYHQIQELTQRIRRASGR